jgi:Ca2+-binding EF-hand superfamily protein
MPANPRKHVERQALAAEVQRTFTAPLKRATENEGSDMECGQISPKSPIPKQRHRQKVMKGSDEDGKTRDHLTPLSFPNGSNNTAESEVAASIRNAFGFGGNLSLKEDEQDETSRLPKEGDARSKRFSVLKKSNSLFAQSASEPEATASKVTVSGSPMGSKSGALRKAPTSSKDKKKSVASTESEMLEIRHLVYLSRKYHIGLDEIKEAREKFFSYDRSGNGEITLDNFKLLAHDFCHIPQDHTVPFHLVDALQDRQHIDGEQQYHGADRTINFEEFLLWKMTCAYTEEMMVQDPADRHIRKLARERGMLLPDVESIKETFDRFDVDRNNKIDEQEFKGILCKLFGLANEQSMSASRLHRYWREVDLKCKGDVGFEEFLSWYCKCFPAGH